MADLTALECLVAIEFNFSVGSPGPKYTTLDIQSPDEGVDLDGVAEAWTGFLDGRLYTKDLTSCALVYRSLSREGRIELDVESKSGDYLPLNTCALVRKNGQGVGRKNRGRMFLPAVVGEAESDGSGLISPTLVTNLQAGLTALYADIVGLGAEPVIHHSGAGLPTPIQSLAIQPLMATLKRRLRR